MALTDLVPWGRNRSAPAASRFTDENSPFLAFQREMNRMFGDFARGFGLEVPTHLGISGAWPRVEINESESEVKVAAELPGMDQKDIDVSIADGMMTIRGEKKSENNGTRYSERWHGQFQRSLPLGPDVDPDQVNAVFKDGVLTVTVQKRPEAQRQLKRIPITTS
jgi:HSP20 family protein